MLSEKTPKENMTKTPEGAMLLRCLDHIYPRFSSTAISDQENITHIEI
jgi:hypothetical protein